MHPAGFSGTGSRRLTLPPKRILIFCARLIARWPGISCWLAYVKPQH